MSNYSEAEQALTDAHHCAVDQQQYYLGLANARAALAAAESLAAVADSMRQLYILLRERLPEQITRCPSCDHADHEHAGDGSGCLYVVKPPRISGPLCSCQRNPFASSPTTEGDPQ